MISDMTSPLRGYKVLDLGVWHAGPGGAAILGDLGAEVIKVESLDGDPERSHGGFGKIEGKSPIEHPGWNMLHEMSNRNKTSISLDFKTSEGREILDRLIMDCDIIISNTREASREKLGIDFKRARTLNDRLIYVSVSAFGSQGPYATTAGFDTMGQAMGGMMYLAGGEQPIALQMIILDQMTAVFASQAALLGIVMNQAQPEPRLYETSLLTSAIALQQANVFIESIIGESIDWTWDRVTASPLRTTLRCGDGKWIMGTNHPPERYWPDFCRAIGREDLITDPRFDTKEKISGANKELYEIIDARFLEKDRDEWLSILTDAGLLFAPVNSIQETLKDEQVLANQYVTQLDHPLLGELSLPAFPVRVNGKAIGTRKGAPELGADSDVVLRSLGYSDDEIDTLIASGVINVFNLSKQAS